MTGIAIHNCLTGNPVLFEDNGIAVVGFERGKRIERGHGTLFVAVAAGELKVNGSWFLSSGMYASVPLPALFKSLDCRAMLVRAKRYRGVFMLGGPLEEAGRLRYIDGCTDTGLIQPFRCGDPCLNYLHFPPGIHQTEHHHPSHRVGLICGGAGWCHTRTGSFEMRAGNIFVLPKGEKHSFETMDEEMRIVAFHPDSEFGPTDESHQMLNATLVS